MANTLDNWGCISVSHPGGYANIYIGQAGEMDLDELTNVCAAAIDAMTGVTITSTVTITESIERPVDS